jgi:apolipoprotein D and lipocalin family protein
MKILISILLLFIYSSSSFSSFGITNEVKTVDSVDPLKFIGTWYRISSRPIIFEPNCACARQVLTAKPNNSVGVYNTCNKNVVGGKLVTIGGYASPLDNTFTKFDVHFKGAPLTGSYWVIALDTDYRWAVVSDKYGYSLYVMSREPQLAPELYKEAVLEASSNGAPVDKLVMQVQNGCAPYPSENN